LAQRVYVCIYIHTYIYTYLYTCLYTCMYTCIYMCIYVYICVHDSSSCNRTVRLAHYVCVYIYTYVHMYIYKHMCINIYINSCLYIFIKHTAPLPFYNHILCKMLHCHFTITFSIVKCCSLNIYIYKAYSSIVIYVEAYMQFHMALGWRYNCSCAELQYKAYSSIVILQ